MTLERELARLRAELEQEAATLPSTNMSYGRPHEHPRARHLPRYTSSGRRIPGTTRIPPDCPKPSHGRCECPPDGSWRATPGATRADAVAIHARLVRATAPAARPIGEDAWVAEVYEQGPDGLWRCRWPLRRALERLRGASTTRWRAAIGLLAGEPIEFAWDEPPADPAAAARRLIADLDRWSTIERDTEYERRPRQWWDKPPRRRPAKKSEVQLAAEAAGPLTAPVPVG